MARKNYERKFNVNGTVLLVRGTTSSFLSDIYYYVLVSKWRQLVAVLCLFYLAVNTLFGMLFLMGGNAIAHAKPGSYWDAFFFSVQTWATIGYGTMAPNSRYADILVAIESFCGILSMSVMTGIVFSKFARPLARVRFSKNFLISKFNGQPVLFFRIGNLRHNQIVEARLRVVFVSELKTLEGLNFRKMTDLPLVRDTTIMFSLTWLAIHEINEQSPLFGLKFEDLIAKKAQITVSLTGHDSQFNQTVHARHTYRPEDMLNGVRFQDMLSHEAETTWVADYSKFDDVVTI